MFNDLLLHESTKLSLIALAKQPPQGLLLVGPEGMGKLTVAKAWANHVVSHVTDVRVVAPDDRGTITIDSIRELYKTTRSKQQGRQVVIVDHADGMSLEAENAFLKLLEEPRPGLTFILTALQLESLLPTILSRVQHITLQPLADETLRRHIIAKKPGVAQNDLSQLVFLAQGRPGIALDLLLNDGLPKQRERMQLVKQLVTAKPYERFSLINKLATDRDGCIASLQGMARIIEAQLKAATSPAQIRHWAHIANTLELALQAISHNGNIRAQLLHLFSSY